MNEPIKDIASVEKGWGREEQGVGEVLRLELVNLSFGRSLS